MSTDGAVYFLTDYGRSDELVGVVHATLVRLVPQVRVVDLTHEVPPYAVAHGARVLERAAPYLGPGVVLAVVDPGVGGPRRALAVEAEVEVATPSGPRYWVGPDNGLLLPGMAALGGPRRAVALETGPGAGAERAAHPGAGRAGGVTGPGVAATFHGRDLFAPAVAALWAGTPLEALGPPVDPATLVALPPPICELAELPGGRRGLRVEVTWVDRFGNVQLAADAAMVPPGTGPVAVSIEPVTGTRRHRADGEPRTGSSSARPGGAVGWRSAPAGEAGPELQPAERVRTFGDLAPGQLGLIGDANGRLALVLAQASAAARLGLQAGDVLRLHW